MRPAYEACKWKHNYIYAHFQRFQASLHPRLVSRYVPRALFIFPFDIHLLKVKLKTGRVGAPANLHFEVIWLLIFSV